MRKAWTGGIAFAVFACATAFADDSSARNWYQSAANDARTSCVDVEPIRAEPVVAWQKQLELPLVCGPVTWGGTIFALTKDAQGRQVLLAIDSATGEIAARAVRPIHKGDTALLAVWEGMVAVVEPESVEGFAFRGTTLKASWRRDGVAFGFPCVHDGILYVANTQKVASDSELVLRCERAFVMASGRDLGHSISEYGGFVSVTTPVRSGSDAQIVGVRARLSTAYQGIWLAATSGGIKNSRSGGGLSFEEGAAPDFPSKDCETDIAPIRDARELTNWYGVIRVAPDATKSGGAWLLLGGVTLATRSQEPCQVAIKPDGGAVGLLPAVTRPAVRQGRAYSFDAKGDLLEFGPDGRYSVILEPSAMPKGAEYGAPSIARNVICFGNWAVDLESRRVLWVRPVTGKILSPSIPVADGSVLLVSMMGELTCLKDPNAAAPAVSPPSASSRPAAPAAPSAAAPAPLALPKAIDGILLKDGRQIAGSVSIGRDGSVLVTPEGGAGQLIARDDVVVAEEGGVVVAHGPEREVFRVWRDALRAAYVKRIEELVPAALELELPQKASELLDRARKWGMSETRATELARRITGKRDAVNLDLRLKGFAKREAPANDATYSEILDGANWCGTRGFPSAGAALLSLAIELAPGRADAARSAAKLVPAEFPVKGDGAAAAWLAWAPFIVAADAHFLTDTDRAWQRTQRAPWDKDTIALRTPNLLLFARTPDASVVGPCLEHGEQAVRALHTLLGVGESAATVSDDDRLEVRLHRNRADYLAEAGQAYVEWTVGYFSPGENVSRFYVPEKDASPLPLGRGLFKTMAHELTHHYVQMRWAPKHGGSARNTDSVPGFWVVEGLARFVEDQVVDSETRGLTFADATVPSVDAASQLSRAGKLLAMDRFCDADHFAFLNLSPEPAIDVRLARSLLTYRLSDASAFYEQAGSLVFFLWNQRGADGRAAFVEYLRLHYNGVLGPKSWTKLGFESAAALDKAYRDWLATLGR